MGYKEGDQGESPIGAVKAVGRFYMVFKGAVESFDELLVGSVRGEPYELNLLEYHRGK